MNGRGTTKGNTMTKLNLYSTRNDRIEWVQAQIAGLFDLEYSTDLYDTPEKWEKIIDGAMGAARDYDAQSISSDNTEHTRAALEELEQSHLLEELNHPFSSIGRTIFNRNMASLIVSAADSVDSQLAAALQAFKEATQEAVNNLARAEIDKQIHDAEAGIAYLKGQRAKLDKAGADSYEVFLRQPWPRRSGE